MGWIEMVGFVISWTQLGATPQNISDGSPLELIWWKSRKNNGKAVSQANKEICVPLQKRPEKFAHIFAFFFKSQMCIFLGESVHFYPLFIPRGSSHLIWDNFKRVTRYLQRAIFGHNWHHIRPRDGPNPSTTHLPRWQYQANLISGALVFHHQNLLTVLILILTTWYHPIHLLCSPKFTPFWGRMKLN